MEHFDLVEKLVKTFGVSYEQAKEALEAANWDAVEAAILIEKEQKTAGAEQTAEPVFNAESLKEQLDKGVKNARKGTAAFFKKAADLIDDSSETADGNSGASEQPKQSFEDSEAYKEAKRRCDAAKEKTCGFFNGAADFFDKNHFVVAKPTGETFLDLPLWIMIILCVIFFWAVLGVLLLTLIMGYHFSFSGPQFGNKKRSAPKSAPTEDVPEPVVKNEDNPNKPEA